MAARQRRLDLSTSTPPLERVADVSGSAFVQPINAQGGVLKSPCKYRVPNRVRWNKPVAV